MVGVSRGLDDATLESLKMALAAIPGLLSLATVVARECLEAKEPGPARQALVGCNLGAIRARSDRELVARVLLAVCEAAKALEYADGREPSADLLLARILHALSRDDDTLRAYPAAVAASSALEDRELLALLKARVHEAPAVGAGLRAQQTSKSDGASPTDGASPADEPPERPVV